MIVFIPVGGLANRMRSMASAISFAKRYGCKIKIIWFKDSGLNCSFNSIFQPIEDKDIILKEASILDYLVYDRPRKKNYFLPLLFQKIIFSERIYEKTISEERRKKIFNLDKYARCRQMYIASHDMFYPVKDDLWNLIFKVTKGLKEELDKRSQSFNQNTVGIHIRRTDHTIAIKTNKTEFFIKKMKELIEKNNKTNFYLATDSESEKEELINIFKDRIITSPLEANRNSSQGIKEAIIEFYLLARTNQIIGSSQSSFSEIAALIGNIDLYTPKS